MKYLVLVLLAGVLGVVLYIRLAPSRAEIWHVTPDLAEDPGAGGVRATVVASASPDELMARLDRAVMAEDRVVRLAGDVPDLHVTYVARTKLMRFPDFITIKVDPSETGSRAVILSRLRFGKSDMGVNAVRLGRVLDRAGLERTD